MHPLIEHGLQQRLGAHRGRIILDDHQMRLLVVVGDAGNALMSPDRIGNLGAAVVVDGLVHVDDDIDNIHGFLPCVLAPVFHIAKE